MDSYLKSKYIITDISNISPLKEGKENNFISIINIYENKTKNNINPEKLSISQRNILVLDAQKENNKNNNDINSDEINDYYMKISDSEELNDEKSKTVEISASGSIKIKNNKIFQNKNNVISKFNDNNILNFDDKAEDILIDNNQYNSSKSNNKNKINNNSKNENNSEFILQDIPLNINNEEYINKWKKLFFLCMEKNFNYQKKVILNILEDLIIFKKNNEKANRIEMIEINYNGKENNIIKKIKSRNENYNDEPYFRNSYNINNNSIRDSTDSRASYDNLTNIITTTQINNLSNSSDNKNTINNINININNTKLIIPSLSKFSDESENLSSSQRNNYQKTDYSNILLRKNILNSEKLKNLISFLDYKSCLFDKASNNDSANVLVSLDSEIKNKKYGLDTIQTIKEEDNESYDSLSLQKSVRNSGKATPNKMEIKKSSFKDMQNIINNQNNFNNNLSNAFNNDNEIEYNNNLIREKEIENEEEDEIIGNDILFKKINNIKSNRQNKIITIDIDMNNDSKNNIEGKINSINLNNENEISGGKNYKEEVKEEEIDEITEKKNKKNYSTPESKEKTIKKIYESVKGEINKKNAPKEFNSIENDSILQFSDFNNIINQEEEDKEEGKKNEKILNSINNNKINERNELIKRIIIKEGENFENEETFKKINIKDDKEEELKAKIKNDQKIILPESNIKNSLKDSILSLQLKTPESSIIDINKESEDNNKLIESNIFNSISINSNKGRPDDFLKYRIKDYKNRIIIFSQKDNTINNITYSIPLESYIYILQLCLNKKLSLPKKYGFLVRKMKKKLENNNKIQKIKNLFLSNENDDNEKKINQKIDSFNKKMKLLKKSYIYLITKKNNLKSKEEKDKISEQIDIPKIETDIYILFNEVLLLIDNINNGSHKYNIYKEQLRNVLKKYEKISKGELDEAKVKDIQNKLVVPEEEEFNKKTNRDKNIIYDLKKEGKIRGRANLFVITSLIIPLFYIFNYYNSYMKNK